jgi:uncharacterized protein YlxW (UPF0749 family)
VVSRASRLKQEHERLKAEYEELQNRLTGIQNEIADVLLFVEYAKDGKIENLNGDQATIWAGSRMMSIASQIMDLKGG